MTAPAVGTGSGVLAELELAFDRQKTQQQADQLASDIVSQMRQTFDQKMGALREQFQQGLINREEFQTAGQEAGRDFYEGVTEELTKREAAGGLGSNGAGLAKALRREFEDVNRAAVSTGEVLGGVAKKTAEVAGSAEKASPAVKLFERGLTELARESVGVTGGLGKIGEGVLRLAGGGLVVSAAVAGIGLLIEWWRRGGEAARKMQEQVDKVTESLLRERAARLGLDLAATTGQEENEVRRLQEEQEAAERGVARVRAEAERRLFPRGREGAPDALANAQVQAYVDASAAGQKLLKVQADLQKAQDAYAEATRKQAEFAKAQRDAGIQAIVTLGGTVAKDTEARTQALAIVKADRDELDRGNVSLQRRAELTREIAALTGASVKQAKDDASEQARRQRELEQAAKNAAKAIQHVYDEISRAAKDSLTLQGPVDERFRQETRAFYERMQEQAKALDEMNRKLAQAESAGVDFPELPELMRKAKEEAVAFAQAVADAADATIRVGQELGVVNEKMAGVLSSAFQVGTSLVSGNIPGVITGVGGLIGGIVSQSPEEKAHEQNVRDNTQALKDLTARAVELTLTGREQADATRALAAFNQTGAGRAVARYSNGLSLFGTRYTENDFTDELTRAAESVGLSFDDLVKIADSLHITLDGTADSVKKFNQALGLTSTLPANTYAGKSQNLQNQIALGITPADQELIQTAAILMASSPAFAKALGGIDLSTPEGRAQAKSRIQSLYLQSVTGKGIDPSRLGELSLGQFQDATKNFVGLIDQQGTSAGGNTSSSFTYAGSITNASAMRIDAQLGTANAWLSQIAANTKALVERPMFALQFLPGSISVPTSGGSPIVNPDLIEIDRGLGLRVLDASANYGSAVIR